MRTILELYSFPIFQEVTKYYLKAVISLRMHIIISRAVVFEINPQTRSISIT